MSNYAKYLLHPKWQEKRLKIMGRDRFKCVFCADNSTLHVHHTYYLPQLDDAGKQFFMTR